MAVGAIVSAINSTKCDACNEVTANSPYSLPRSWMRIQLHGGSGVWAVGEEKHACSKACAARVFYKLADACGGIPATAGRPLLETGRPYR